MKPAFYSLIFGIDTVTYRSKQNGIISPPSVVIVFNLS